MRDPGSACDLSGWLSSPDIEEVELCVGCDKLSTTVVGCERKLFIKFGRFRLLVGRLLIKELTESGSCVKPSLIAFIAQFCGNYIISTAKLLLLLAVAN